MQQREDNIAAPLPVLERFAWTAFNALQFAFTLIWTAGLISIALAMFAITGDRHRTLRMASRVWAPGLLWGAGARLQVEGADAVDWSRPYMVVANHASVIDICALFRALPVPLRFLLKQEMTQVPFVGWYAKATGMLFIQREDRRAGVRMLRDAAAILRSGGTLCIFPEGTRSRTGIVAPFKGGAFQSAIDAGVEILPVAISGARAVLPPEGFFRVRPGTIRVRIGQPLSTQATDRQDLAERAHAAVLAMLSRMD